MFLNGKRLTASSDLQKVVGDLFQKEDFNVLLKQLLAQKKVYSEELAIKLAYIFDSYSPTTEQLVSGQVTVIRMNDYTQIIHLEINNEDYSETIEDYSVYIVNEKGQLEIYSFNQDLTFIASQELTDASILDTMLKEEMPHDENFEPFSTVKSESWGISFCLAGGYKHCGPGCGDGLTYGGGTPYNAIDTCCRAHDRCWSVFGNGDACCDKILVDCAKKNASVGSVASALIVGWFSSNASNC